MIKLVEKVGIVREKFFIERQKNPGFYLDMLIITLKNKNYPQMTARIWLIPDYVMEIPR